MKFHRLKALTGGLAVAALIGGLAVSSDAAAPPPIDVSHDRLTCTTITGSFTIEPPINYVGGQPATVTLKGKVDGCTDLDNPNVKLKGSSFTGAFTFSNNFVTALAGVQTVTSGSLTVKWATASGAAKLVQPTTTLNFTQLNGTVGAPGGTFTDSYALFQVGNDAAHGNTAAPSVSGAFAGNDGGVTSTLDIMSGISVTALLGPTYLGAPKDPKFAKAPIGIGQLNLA